MAQNVGTPRFYVDSGLYQSTIGVWTPEEDQIPLVQLNPTNIQGNPSNHIAVPRIHPITYCAFLGHNGNAAFYNDWYDGSNSLTIYGEEIINYASPTVSNGVLPDYTGFTISTFPDNETGGALRGIVNTGNATGDVTIGAVSIGSYYDMPHSPDMNLKMSIEMDGIKTIQSRGGATLSNATYTKPADWGDRGAWQLGSAESGQGISNIRSGRRVWDLSFSYLSDTDIMPKVAATTNYEATNGDYEYAENPNENTLLDGTDFFSVVWNRTMGGHLPFIFQPDAPTYNATTELYEGGNNNPDQFAICRFDMNSLQYEQVANNVYNVKLKIRESW